MKRALRVPTSSRRHGRGRGVWSRLCREGTAPFAGTAQGTQARWGPPPDRGRVNGPPSSWVTATSSGLHSGFSLSTHLGGGPAAKGGGRCFLPGSRDGAKKRRPTGLQGHREPRDRPLSCPQKTAQPRSTARAYSPVGRCCLRSPREDAEAPLSGGRRLFANRGSGLL